MRWPWRKCERVEYEDWFWEQSIERIMELYEKGILSRVELRRFFGVKDVSS